MIKFVLSLVLGLVLGAAGTYLADYQQLARNPGRFSP